MKDKINLGNTLSSFKESFIEQVIEISSKISNLSKEATSEEVLELRKELDETKEEVSKVMKFLNQDITTLTGALIAAKKREALKQDAISIFDFLGKADKPLKPEQAIEQMTKE